MRISCRKPLAPFFCCAIAYFSLVASRPIPVSERKGFRAVQSGNYLTAIKSQGENELAEGQLLRCTPWPRTEQRDQEQREAVGCATAARLYCLDPVNSEGLLAYI